ncbi:hypothetical protein J4727_15260 [Providencia rettgeri]|uniref:Uncharacterized protein n=1 Tax=Providencia rettgeri TaxID=587 RepID=A0A939NKN4_PRORE|nr:hypothetical protein [Providencia rettgeri]
MLEAGGRPVTRRAEQAIWPAENWWVFAHYLRKRNL